MKVADTLGMEYPLMEHFYTIQGEGAHTGRAAYFLRLGGCDVGCVWCDVKESWDAAKHPIVSHRTNGALGKRVWNRNGGNYRWRASYA
jgi:7-carboxy-7-deazaguanine synthase